MLANIAAYREIYISLPVIKKKFTNVIQIIIIIKHQKKPKYYHKYHSNNEPTM